MKKKSILSLLMAVLMIFSVIGVLPAKAAENHTGNLSLEGSEVANMVEHLRKPEVIYLKGDAGLDSVPTVDNDWNNYRYHAANDESGIYRNDKKQSDRTLIKYHKTNNFWFVDGWADMKAGDKVTIKGTFTNTAGDVTVTIPEYTITWDGGRYAGEKKAANATVADLMASDNHTDGFYFETYKDGAPYNDGMTTISWTDNYNPVVAVDSGVYFNNQWTNVHIRKIGDTKYFVCLADSKLKATAGTVINIKGQFTCAGQIVEFHNHKFTFDGSNWTAEKVIDTEYEYSNISINSVNGATTVSPNGRAWYMYFDITGVLPGTAWEVLYKDVKVFVGDTEVTATLKAKKAGEQSFFLEIPISETLLKNPAEGTTLTIKAGSYHGHYFADNTGVGADMGKGITIGSDYTMEWNGSAWGAPQPKIDYTDITVTGVTADWNPIHSRYDIRLITDKELPGVKWTGTFETPQVTMNGKKVDLLEGFYKDTEDKLFMYFPEYQLSKEIKKDTKIVVKAGKLINSSAMKGINLTKDVTIYANQYGWSLTGFVEKPEEAVISFTGLNWATSYIASSSSWHFYLVPDKEIPGVEDQSKYAGVTAEINGKHLTVDMFKSAHEGTVWFEIPSSVLPKNLTKNTTLVIKAGSYIDSKTGAMLTIKKDFNLYGNQYGWSADGYVVPPKTTKVQFTGVNWATQLNATSERWNLYLIPDKTLPGVADRTAYRYVTVEVDGRKGEVEIVKSSHEGTGFIDFSNSLVPKKITKNMKMVLKAGTLTGNDNKNNIQLEKDVVIYINQYGWSTEGYVKPPKTTKVQFMGINSATQLNATSERWNLYLIPDKTLPGMADRTAYRYVTVEVDGRKEAVEIVKSSHEGTAFIDFSNSLVPKKITKNMKMVLKAGTLTGSDNKNNIQLEKDVVIYINQYGWSTEGYVKPPKTTKVQFTGINSATQLNSFSERWNLYLIPNKTLPGVADSTAYRHVIVEVNGKKEAVEIVKSSHEGTAFIDLSNSLVPKKITKNMKMVLKAGTLIGNDNKNNIELTKDVVIYINQYGWSMAGYVKKPKTTTITFTGINQASGYKKDSNTWNLYLTPDKTIPGTPDITSYRSVNVTVNGKSYLLDMYKASHEGTAFMMIPSNILPEKITKNTKFVIKAGTMSGNDSKNAIRFAKDITIYVNQYGWSLTAFAKKPTIKSTNVQLSIDRECIYGGDERGLYLTTSDRLPTDETWGASVKAATYDSTSGVYYNGKKIDAPIKRFQDGKLYVALADAGITAKDKDKVTIRGLFVIGEVGATYKEVSFYYNGKVWNTKYEKAKPATYTKITGKSLNTVSGWFEEGNLWRIYINVDGKLPGNIDTTSFETLTVEVNGKKIDTVVSHSFEDTLFVPVYAKDLAKNAKDGAKITIKAGKALGTDRTSGIQLTNDYTLYVYKGTLSEVEPTTDTKWLKTDVKGTSGAGYYNAEAKMWYLLFQFRKSPVTEHNTVYAQFPLTINGKEYFFTARQDNKYLSVQIPDSVIPADTMNNMKVELKKGAKTWANAGRNGIEISGTWTGYVYNKLIQDKKVTKITETKLNMVTVQNVTFAINAWNVKVHHVYIKMDKEFPGKAWYQSYQDFEYYYNGKKIVTSMSKAESSDNLLAYFPIIEDRTGAPKDGDIVTVKSGTSVSAGGNKITFASDYQLIYIDGIWSEYVKSDMKKPQKNASLWEDFRFEDGFVPAGTDDGSVTSTNETKYNTIYSTEKHKDYTMQFSMTKEFDDEITNPMTIILRGTPVDEDSKLDPSFLNGYVLTMTWDNIKDENGEKVEQQTLHLWKNGKNDALVDVYRVNYVTLKEDHPLYKTGVTYNYDISIWNVNASTVCIEVRINDRLITRYYDHAGTDVKDPVINEGTFAIAYGCPGYLTDTVDTSLTQVISSVDTCVTGEEVQCAVTYPYVAKGTELSVDKEGATITDGVFKAEKAGTYTISGSYNGKKMAEKTIVVTEAPTETVDEGNTSNLPIIPIAGGIVLIALIVIAVLLLKKRGK